MSDVQQGSTSTQQPPSGIRAGVDWVGKHWPRVRLAHEGMMVDKIGRQTQIVEVLARNAMTGDSASTDGWPDPEGDDDMSVKIGDEIHYHAAPEPPQQPVAEGGQTSSPPAQSLPPAAESTLAKWGKRAALAGMIGMGPLGVAAGYYAATKNQEAPPAVEQPEPDRVGGLGVEHGKWTPPEE